MNKNLKSVKNKGGREWLSAFIPLVFFVALLSVLSPQFLSASNISNILRQVSVYAVMAVGMTFVIITGGIDLSQGSLLPIVCIAVSVVLKNGEGSMILAILAGLLAGALSGFVNGVMIAYISIPPFIMTLGMMNALRGAALLITDAASVETKYAPFRFIGTGSFLSIPLSVYIFVIVAIIGYIILSRTAMGRYIYAIGSNKEAARLSGVNTKRTLIFVYMVSGICVAIGAILYIARLGAAQPIAGQSYEMESVAATIIGGTSIMGGEGGVIGSILGAIVMSVIKNGMVLLGVSTYWQQIVLGIIIVIAVVMDLMRKKVASTKNS